jgi:CPA2 family monovalent cation:H+ antiporter-2
VTEVSERGDRVYFGDAARAEFLERVGAAHARAFLVTVNAPHAAERMVAAVRRKRPDAPVFARARDAAHAARLLKLGAVGVTPEAFEASLQLGLPEQVVRARLAALRDQEVGRLAEADDDKSG